MSGVIILSYLLFVFMELVCITPELFPWIHGSKALGRCEFVWGPGPEIVSGYLADTQFFGGYQADT
jgi:hypothetical protein